MQGAARRIAREIEVSNRLAWNTAALTGAALSGKLPDLDAAFPAAAGGAPEAQDDATQEAMLWTLAAAWGAAVPPAPAETAGDP